MGSEAIFVIYRALCACWVTDLLVRKAGFLSQPSPPYRMSAAVLPHK